MAVRRTGSLYAPIIWGSASVTLTLALLVGWVMVIVRNQQLTQQWASGNLWLLVAGILSFATIMTVLILFSIFLARQVLEIRRQTTFVDSVTHELRSPLASLKLALATLGREGLSASQQEELRQMMLDDVERLSAFIDDILQATRVESTPKGRAVSRVSLPALTRRCIAVVVKRHRLPLEQVRVDCPPDAAVWTDSTALEIILKNLLDNAIKYSDPPVDVLVVITVRGDDGRVRIDVIDKGVGIPRRALSRVFDRFYRVDEEAIRARRGTGLGLYVVKALVKNLGGKLGAHSAGPGTGTTMSIVLPTGNEGLENAELIGPTGPEATVGAPEVST
jgi:signal transduction histidine kinase